LVLRSALVTGAAVMVACDAQIGSDKEFEPGPALTEEQQVGLVALQQQAGGPVDLELDDRGGIRVLSMSEGAHLVGLTGTPETVARSFLRQNRGLFRLAADEAESFDAARVDIDAATNLRHVVLQRTVEGVPVYQGSVSVHMDAQGGIFRAVGADGYRVSAPKNRITLSPDEAAVLVGEAVGLPSLNPSLVEEDGLKSVFSDVNTLDLTVEPRVFHVAEGNDRFAYQVLISYKDAENQLQYDLVLVDAESGSVLFKHTLVESLRGKVFLGHPAAVNPTDTRVFVDFTGDPTASPNTWVAAGNKTVGNNAFATTDLNGNNAFGTNEVQPTANAAGDFDFPYAGNSNASNFKEAAVVNAFYFVNNFHDYFYSLGWTETSGNFQTNNFGRGGAGNDEVQVDVQDGSGTDNANFATPPDGSKPRMQMFLFTFTGGVQEDGDFDGTVVYHENGHGLSNRLVGGGNVGCLFGTQSGGMGEGWSDYVAASILNDPVIGAYVTGNSATGIRRASMANSPFTYANIKDGTMTEVHDAGEIWAAALFDIRKVLGQAATDRLVVTGMKLTPCNPSFINARDAIIQADANLNAGANRCLLSEKFAARGMGEGASSPNHNSTSTVVVSTAVPANCGGTPPPPPTGGSTATFTATDVPKAVPDNNATGATSTINVPAGLGALQKVTVDTSVTHTFRGDLVVTLTSPDGKNLILSNRAGGSADNFVATALDVTSSFVGSPASGAWKLKVQDLASADVGTINSFKVNLTTASSGGNQGATFTGTASPNSAIPDNNTTGISSTISSASSTGLQVQSVQVKLNITHSFRGDLQVTLTSPANETRTVIAPAASDSADNITGTFNVAGFTAGSNGAGNWTLKIVDKASADTGTLVNWSLGVNTTAP
jgi:subtilisin-like proprotein convertase family protein/Zn-dependent metalloprotease